MRTLSLATFVAAFVGLLPPTMGEAGPPLSVSWHAAPGGAKDDTEAFLAAFRSASTGETRRVTIPRGVYRLRADGNPENRGSLLRLVRRENLTIEGEGVEMRLSGDGGVFDFYQCTNVTVRGMTIDWERPPFSEGTVIATTPRSFDVKVLPEYPVQGGEPVGAFMSYDPATRLPTGKGLDVYDSVARTEAVGPQVLRVHLKRDIPVPVGTLLVLRHRVYGHNAFVFSRCQGMRLEHAEVFAAPGMGLVAVHSRDVSLRQFNVRLRPGSRRLMSATADATHFGGCQGTVTLEDCLFEGMGDDGANIKSGLYLLVRRRLDDRTVLGQHNLKMADLPDAGDWLELSHTDTLLPFASNRVDACRLEPGPENLHWVHFTEPLPAELREGDVLGNATRAPALRMRRCTVAANRARGVLCQTRDALIEDCVFRRCTSAGVLVLTEVVHFHESIGTRQVTVRNNRFEYCNLGAASAEAPLAALAWLKDFAYPPQPGVHRDITFAGNRFLGASGSPIFAVGVEGLTLKDNRVESADGGSATEPAPASARVRNCAKVVADTPIGRD